MVVLAENISDPSVTVELVRGGITLVNILDDDCKHHESNTLLPSLINLSNSCLSLSIDLHVCLHTLIAYMQQHIIGGGAGLKRDTVIVVS